MRLATTPPKGAGQVRHTTKTELLLRHIDGLGNDKTGKPIGIRVVPLAEATGVPAASIPVLLAKHVQGGRVCACKISVPGSGTAAQTEYRRGVGVPIPEWKPLDTKRAGIAMSTAGHTARPDTHSSATPQPAVGNTGSAQSALISPDERAVTSDPETPGPQPERRGMGPAPAKAPAGDVFSITLDDTGVLIIVTDEAVIELQPKQAQRLGHFLVGSQGVWNPF